MTQQPTSAPYHLWGQVGEDFDRPSLDQLENACRLPVARAGALMPDAHVGYGLPIGGVLATENAVVPYAVGVDIACRVKMTVLDIPPKELDHDAGRDRLAKAIEQETRFGVGAQFGKRSGNKGHRTPLREHDVMDEDWSVSKITQHNKDRAWSQLGTSGSGNHFVEFGVLTIGEHGDDLYAERAPVLPEGDLSKPKGRAREADRTFDLPPGTYLALLSHSGSRGTGAAVCDHYSKLAMQLRPDLDKQMKHLAWLDLESEPGQEYWQAMNLMGRYASANHACIHHWIAKHLGARVIGGVENHHNFAWKETHTVTLHDGSQEDRELIVHRKGATPAGEGVLGIIPGSMAKPGYVVRGIGGDGARRSLASAAHGAGRVMSRSQAKKSFRWNHVKDDLEQASVTLLSAGIDENPRVYKDIRQVMARQSDLVEPIARFDPRLVKMAPAGERPED
ncbi:MAG: RtcB family protein [Phycisphaerales bacterium]|jgi:tRNA-splicing ligase RtcB